jgi:hypothetical protein
MDLFDRQILVVLTDGKSRGFQQILQEVEFFHNTLSPHLARLERQGMQEGQRQMRASKLPPNPKREINTIFNHFSNTLARALRIPPECRSFFHTERFTDINQFRKYLHISFNRSFMFPVRFRFHILQPHKTMYYQPFLGTA